MTWILNLSSKLVSLLVGLDKILSLTSNILPLKMLRSASAENAMKKCNGERNKHKQSDSITTSGQPEHFKR